MRPVARIGFRREVLILVPASLLVLLMLAVFTLLSYRSAVSGFADQARDEAVEAVRVAASKLARDRLSAPWPPSSERLGALLPGAVGVALLDPGSTVTLVAWRDGERRDVRIKLGDRPLSGLANPG